MTLHGIILWFCFIWLNFFILSFLTVFDYFYNLRSSLLILSTQNS
ncbi:hypothetical protein E9M_06630 [Moraxella catarrhalis 46P47B1]|uniref:Membrane protein n=1 Tax=Moraxella catarrhalis TaxID=480 RepID=A0A198XLB0_MORCA|nr:putative membrane protein [Moraxella catarrhalis BBH18]AZQ87863.1 putative membrane protein [Moraxella catarrhalis]EGE11621.1 hypothetical protein E9M_06630 [Moraxella catarrhalis 46P47B1]EGE15340.1 hypothetical protein E9K_03511 [Moraxella catarrhalis 103P14B1]EGE16261.1 hypothetical protein E9Q_08920 [Moraxella catarrhalis BC1]EGE17911.1 hypothetical protein E9O_00205 [Moraxella catarrhalis 12P80B1]EGE22168.1 hypothetical protein E9S_01009 [Moraxella catarrhalis BC7]EGE23680.1 hypotheti